MGWNTLERAAGLAAARRPAGSGVVLLRAHVRARARRRRGGRRVVRLRAPVRGRGRARPALGHAVPPREERRRRAGAARQLREGRSRDRWTSTRRSTSAAGASCSSSRATTTARRTTTTIRSRSRGASRRAGARWIHVVDLDAARDGGDANLGVIEAICANVSVRVQTGGGVRSVEDAGDRFAAGVAPRRDRERGGRAPRARRRAGARCIRARSRSGSTRGAATSRSTVGPRRPAPTSSRSRARFDRPGVGALVVTEIGRDGMLGGPRPRSARARCSRRPTVPIIASGGVGSARRPARARGAGGEAGAARPAPSSAPPSTRAASPSPKGSPRARRPRDPVPRRRRRPRREGRELRRDPRRRRPGRARGALRRGGRRRARVPRHHRVVGRPRHDGARGRAGRRAGVHPVHGRRRHPHRRRRPPHAARRRRQGVAQHRGRERPRPRARSGADEFGNQCIVVAIDARRRNADDRARAGRS